MGERLSKEERAELRQILERAPFLGALGERICDLSERLIDEPGGET